jgi:hypothetical protein
MWTSDFSSWIWILLVSQVPEGYPSEDFGFSGFSKRTGFGFSGFSKDLVFCSSLVLDNWKTKIIGSPLIIKSKSTHFSLFGIYQQRRNLFTLRVAVLR